MMPRPLLSLLRLHLAATLLSSAAASPACPPFLSPPTTSFPFSSAPGCGHPSFHIRCSAPHSLLSINTSPFLILSLLPPNSLLLSPSINDIISSECRHLPSAPINLSASPFQIPADLCRRLSSLRPCRRPSPAIFSSCSPFQRRLLSRPTTLFPECPSSPHSHLCSPNSSAALSALLRSGFRLQWDPHSDPYFLNCSSCLSGLCGFNSSAPSKPFLCFSPSLPRPRHHPRFFIITAFSAVLVVAVVASLIALLHRTRSNPDHHVDFLRRLSLPVFTFEELNAATAGFDSRRKIGDGGFGSVYLANLSGGMLVAVKRLHRRHMSEFCNEVMILSAIRHPNLVQLHGYCCDPRGLLLVYDYVPNGTLADHLHGPRRPLDWGLRLDAALQTATVLEYLHFAIQPPVVHRDVTSSNIFIERDYRIKVGDFGLSRLLVEQVRCTGPQGTPGYLDPDYHRSFRLTEKSDVYSFGVVLMEMITGSKAVDFKREKGEVGLADMVVSKIQVGELHQVVDPVLAREGEGVMRDVEAVAELAFRCVAGDKDDRPDSREVVVELKRIHDRIELLKR